MTNRILLIITALFLATAIASGQTETPLPDYDGIHAFTPRKLTNGKTSITLQPIIKDFPDQEKEEYVDVFIKNSRTIYSINGKDVESFDDHTFRIDSSYIPELISLLKEMHAISARANIQKRLTNLYDNDGFRVALVIENSKKAKEFRIKTGEAEAAFKIQTVQGLIAALEDATNQFNIYNYPVSTEIEQIQ